MSNTLKIPKTQICPSIARLCALVLIGFFLLASHSGFAAGVNLSSIEPLKDVPHMPDEAFESKTQLIEATPFEDKFLSFSVRLPKDWKPEVIPPMKNMGHLKHDSAISPKVLGEVARYVSPPRFTRRSFFTLEASALEYEIGARDWFINHLFQNGQTPLALSAISPREAKAIYIEVQKDTTYAVRVKVQINDGRVMVARYFVPQDDFKDERVMQAQVIDGFTLTNMGEGGVELWKTHKFLDQSYFDYPASWTLQAPIVRSIERMRATLFRGEAGQNPEGQIKVLVISKLLGTTLGDEVKDYRDKLNITDYTLGERIESLSYQYHPDMHFGVTEVYKLLPNKTSMVPYEMVVSVMESDDYYYILHLLTPSRSREFYRWSRNMDAYRIVVETTRRYNAEKDDYYQYLDE